MGLYRDALPPPGAGPFLADGGGEWEALRSAGGRAALREHLLGLLELARALDAGFILDAPVFQCTGLPLSRVEVEEIDRKAIAFAEEVRDAAAIERPVLLNATLGPCPDWDGGWRIVGDEADRLFVRQLHWLADSRIDLASGPVFDSAVRAIGFVEAVRAAGLPVAVTLGLRADGRLSDGQPLGEAIEAVDAFTGAVAAWFTVECADPAILAAALEGREGWTRRIRGFRATPYTPEAEPAALRRAYDGLAARAPWIAIAGLAGGRNLRHATAMARSLRTSTAVPA